MPARAWWDYGHRTVADIAWSELSPTAKRDVRTLLAHAPELATPTCPLRTLRDASVWPDCVKTLGDRFSHMESWHYQDVDVCRPFALKGTCPGGNCVTVQIERQARLLADHSVPPRERLVALALLVHFVGDLHQPLHIGEHHDQGGNAVKVSYGAIRYDKLSLHQVWDGLMAERLISEPPPLRQTITPALRDAWRQGQVADWAEESWQRARDLAYGKLPVADACALKPGERIAIDSAYVDSARAALRTAVAEGGVRAGLLIERALGPRQPKPAQPVEPLS